MRLDTIRVAVNATLDDMTSHGPCPAHEAAPARSDGGAVQGFLRRSILFYQRAREGRPSPCRFFPSCSAYALDAVSIHGARRGSWLAARRLVRCRPLGPSGFDPVPPLPRKGT